MHRPQFFTWPTHTAEATTLLEATRLQKLYTYMCNIVTEFYSYSIVYIYLINSRLDVTHSVHHHFCTIQTLSAYLVEMSNFVAVLALGILSWTLLSQLVVWLSTSHALSLHPWGFSRLMTRIRRSLFSRIILSLILSITSFCFVALVLVLSTVICSKVH